MAPLMPSEDPNSPKTRLLTLLNVSASRSNKKRRLDALLAPEDGPRKKLNARKVVVVEEEGTKGEGSGSGSDESDEEEAEEGAGVEVAASDADPGYTSHFGPTPPILTDAARTSTLERTYTTANTTYGALGTFSSSTPAFSFPQPALLDEQSAATHLHPRLRTHWSTHLSTLPPKSRAQHSSALALLASRKDVYHGHLAGNIGLHDTLRRCTAVHGLDHVLKKSEIVLGNTKRIKARESKAKKASKSKSAKSKGEDAVDDKEKDAVEEEEEEMEPDQGFTRPALLILTPFRAQALKWLSALSSSLPGSKIEGEERYKKEFGLPEGSSDKLREAQRGVYAEDHVEILSGNVDDSFRLGLRLTKRGMKAYTEFYSSDILIASPLGLRLAIEKNKNYDFLSSIEIAVIDQADVMRMQNWEHVQFVMSHLNELPKESHETDFGRVKAWYLDGHATHLRQTLLLSRHETPETRALYNKSLKNVEGKVRAVKRYGAVRVPEGVDTQFMTLPLSSSRDPVGEPDARFAFVTTQVLPAMLKSAVQSSGACIVVPDSLDFVRVGNWFRKQDLSHATLSEYATGPEISRARQSFFVGNKSWLIVSERFWFYHRYTLRGIRHLLFYAPPAHSQCYAEFVAYPFADKDVQPEDVTVRVVAGRLDALALERIVGSKAVGGLIAGAQ